MSLDPTSGQPICWPLVIYVCPLHFEVEAHAEAVPAKAGFLCTGGIAHHQLSSSTRLVKFTRPASRTAGFLFLGGRVLRPGGSYADSSRHPGRNRDGRSAVHFTARESSVVRNRVAR